MRYLPFYSYKTVEHLMPVVAGINGRNKK